MYPYRNLRIEYPRASMAVFYSAAFFFKKAVLCTWQCRRIADN